MPEITRFSQVETVNKNFAKNRPNIKTTIKTETKDQLDIKTPKRQTVEAMTTGTTAAIKDPKFLDKVSNSFKNGKSKAASMFSTIVCGIFGTKATINEEPTYIEPAVEFSNAIPAQDEKPFNTEKVFNSLIDTDFYYKKAIDGTKDIELKTAFNENKITEKEIEKYLVDQCGYLSFKAEGEGATFKNNPAKLHALNLMCAINLDDQFMGHTLKERYLSNLNPNITTEEVETSLKILTKQLEQNPNIALYAQNFVNVAKMPKETIALGEIYKDIAQRCGFDEEQCSQYSIFDTMTEFDSPEEYNELLKFLGSTKKRTVENGDVKQLFNLRVDDCRKTRKFYESLKDDVLEKLDFRDIEELLEIEGKKSVEISKILNKTPKEVLDDLSPCALRTYIDFKDFYKVNNINELTIEQKRKLLKQLVSSNASIFITAKSVAQVLPSNQKEYCSLLDKLAKSTSVNTKNLTTKELSVFDEGLDGISNSIQNVDLNNAHFELAFPRKDFIEKVSEQIKDLDKKEKNQVMDYFGFEISDGKLKGYPINVNNNQKLSEIPSSKVKEVIENIRPIVEEFSSNENTIKVTNGTEEFNKDINKILNGLPELRTTIKKAQHGTHAFTLDIHTFKVLQQVCSNPKFQYLSEEDKKTLEIASLLHDITKQEGVINYMHPVESSFDAYYIIQKLNLPKDQQLKIYELIKTHNWLQQLNNAEKDMVENIAQDIAFDTRHTNTFELAKILCEADMKSVKKDDSFFNYYAETLQRMGEKVDGYIKMLHNTQIVLPQTKIPKASEVKFAETKTKDGITNKVLYFDEFDDDLSKYGFAPGTTKSNWTALVHALEYPEQMSKFDTLNTIDTEALLSASFINPNEYKVFRKQGVLLDVDYSDIHAGYESDFGSGNEKSIELLKEDYLFYGLRKEDKTAGNWRSDRSKYREYIPKKIQEELNITPKEYYKRTKALQNCHSVTDIEKVDKEFADGLLNVFKNMHSRKRKGGRQYNEILVSKPETQGTFGYDEKYEDLPLFLRKYAQDNDLVILMFGNCR